MDNLQQVWLDGDYIPPQGTVAYEPQQQAWYVVVDDSLPIIELADEEGRNYVIPKNQCYLINQVYICNTVMSTSDAPMTDRQFFANEAIIPVLDQVFNLL